MNQEHSSNVTIEVGKEHGEPYGLALAAQKRKSSAPTRRRDQGTEYDEVWCVIDVEAPQLNTFGFGNVHSFENGAELVPEEFHIVRWRRSRPLGLPDLKKLYADASVEGRRLMVLTEYSLSGPAEGFADRSRSFVFRFDPSSARILGEISSPGRRCSSGHDPCCVPDVVTTPTASLVAVGSSCMTATGTLLARWGEGTVSSC